MVMLNPRKAIRRCVMQNLRKMFYKLFRFIEFFRLIFIGKVYVSKVNKDLSHSKPTQVIKRDGYVFTVKSTNYIIGTPNGGLTVGEFAAIYNIGNGEYIIGTDKSYERLSSLTKRWVIEHEIAHVTHNLDNPYNRTSIETKVDIAAARVMGISNIKLRRCLLDCKRNSRFLSGKKVMNKRLNNINKLNGGR